MSGRRQSQRNTRNSSDRDSETDVEGQISNDRSAYSQIAEEVPVDAITVNRGDADDPQELEDPSADDYEEEDDEVGGDEDDDEDDFDMDEDSEEIENDLPFGGAQMDLMSTLQSMLFGGAGDLDAIRRTVEQLQASGTGASRFFFGSGASGSTHAAAIKSMLHQLPAPDNAAALSAGELYTVLAGVWEMLVVTGEEVDAFEFDTVVDVRPLIPQLLRVLRGDDPECMALGGELQLTALRTLRTCCQYSPRAQKALLDGGVAPLLAAHLAATEYIDCAEDTVQTLRLLSRPSASPRAVLHAGGLQAVLRAVDFFIEGVQEAAFETAAQAATALTDDTLVFYLTPDLLAILHDRALQHAHGASPAARAADTWALRALTTAFEKAPRHSEAILPPALIGQLLATAFLADQPLHATALLHVLSAVALRGTASQRAALLVPSLAQLVASQLSHARASTLLDVAVVERVIGLCLGVAFSMTSDCNVSALAKVLVPAFAAQFRPLPGDVFLGAPEGLLDGLALAFRSFYVATHLAARVRLQLLVLLYVLDALGAGTSSDKSSGTLSSLAGLWTRLLDSPLEALVTLEWLDLWTTRDVEAVAAAARRQGLMVLLARPRATAVLENVSIGAGELEILVSQRLAVLGVTAESVPPPLGSLESHLSLLLDVLQARLLSLLNTVSCSVVDPLETLHCWNDLETRLASVSSAASCPDTALPFTEFEMLGHPSGVAARALKWIASDDASRPDCTQRACPLSPESIQKLTELTHCAFNRYNDQFDLLGPRPAASRLTANRRRPLEVLAPLLARPLRLRAHVDSTPRTVLCDPLATIALLAQNLSRGDGERRRALLMAMARNDSDTDASLGSEVVDLTVDSPASPMNLIPTRFEAPHRRVFLHLQTESSTTRIPLQPDWTIVQVLVRWAAPSEMTLQERLDALTSGLSEWGSHCLLVFETDKDGRSGQSEEQAPEDDGAGSAPVSPNTAASTDTDIETPASPTAFTIQFTPSSLDTLTEPLQRALRLLKRLKEGCPGALAPAFVNPLLNAKLLALLDDPLLCCLNVLPEPWLLLLRDHGHLFARQARIAAARLCTIGSLRTLQALQQRVGLEASGQPAAADALLPRRKFHISRKDVLGAWTRLCSIDCGALVRELRTFDFEYDGELGSGLGPTLEFYALASRAFSIDSKLWHQPTWLEQRLLFPAFGSTTEHSWWHMGAFVARAWLDDHVIDLPLHPAFVVRLRHCNEAALTAEELQTIDPQLALSLASGFNGLQGLPFAFMDTPLSDKDSHTITTPTDARDFVSALLTHWSSKTLTIATHAFRAGFAAVFPAAFDTWTAALQAGDVAALLAAPGAEDWSRATIHAALRADHGYTPTSPQITWLARALSEYGSVGDRAEVVRFLTGAARLPDGGWPALRPPLTIVCKTFEHDEQSIDAASPSDSHSSIASAASAHDAYLPSVMTCANYLKLPRYSSFEVLRDRLWYAVAEGLDSFHLS